MAGESTMLRTTVEDAAQWLLAARRRRMPLEPLPPAIRPMTADDGYDVQDARHRLLDDGGQHGLGGWKIGCTSKVLQNLLNIRQPAAGRFAAADVHRSGAVLRLQDFIRVGVECEIAVELGEDLPPGGVPWRRESVADRVAACRSAIEVVDDRYSDFRTLGAPTLIADDFFQAAVVLGERCENWRDMDLGALSATTAVDGLAIGQGKGADLMGHPLEPLAWLANHLAARGQGLRRGDIVLTGSMVAVHWAKGPCSVRIENSAFGPVELSLARNSTPGPV